MKKDNNKTYKIIGVIIAILIIVLFLDNVLGEFLTGWNNPK